MDGLVEEIESIGAQTSFSGVVRVDDGARIVFERGFGLAHRAHGIPNRPDTQFGIASGTKLLTALTVVSLVEEGRIELATPARDVLGSDLPLVGADVTVEHLLAHRSGIGDYLDEDTVHDFSRYVMPVPVHELATTEQYVPALEGRESKFAPDERFAYSNSGYVVLALVAERVARMPFHELVRERVCEPAGLHDTEFLRSDELPARAALGYLEVDGTWRSNVLHLPVRGSGDGGAYSTVADVRSLWQSFFAGAIVSDDWVDAMTRSRSDVPAQGMGYGLGLWLKPTGEAVLEGSDAGVSFRSVHDPVSGLTHTVVSNTSEGAWPIARLLDRRAPLP